MAIDGLDHITVNASDLDASRRFLYKVTRALGQFEGDSGAFLRTTIGAMVLFVLANIIRIRKAPVAVGVETMIGKQAVVRTALDPSGYVFLEGEAWAADIEGGQDVESGEHVIITEVHGLRLKVKKEESEGEEEDGTAPTAG